MLRPVLLAALLLALAATPSHGATPLGFNDNAVAQGIVSPGEDARLLAGVGARIHRLTFDWRNAEKQPGRLDLAAYDAIYAADLAHGVRPLFIVLFAPQWTIRPGTVCGSPCKAPPAPEHADAFRRIVRTLVTRYPRMAALEVWNEPNLAFFWQPWPDPEAYTRLVQEAKAAVREAGSRVPVLAGSVSNAPAGGYVPGVGATEFVEGMYAAGAAGHFDGLSVHPYPEGLDLAPALRSLTEIREVQATHGDETPLWITETGATTTAGGRGLVSEAQQAALLNRLVDAFGAMPDVRAVLLHTLLEPPSGPQNHETGFGILRTDGTPKPAYCALAPLRPACPARPRLASAGPELEANWDAQLRVQRAVDAVVRGGRVPGGVEVFRVGDGVVLCGTSRARRSYCAAGAAGRWVYGSAAGPVEAAAGALLNGSSFGW